MNLLCPAPLKYKNDKLPFSTTQTDSDLISPGEAFHLKNLAVLLLLLLVIDHKKMMGVHFIRGSLSSEAYSWVTISTIIRTRNECQPHRGQAHPMYVPLKVSHARRIAEWKPSEQHADGRLGISLSFPPICGFKYLR